MLWSTIVPGFGTAVGLAELSARPCLLATQTIVDDVGEVNRVLPGFGTDRRMLSGIAI